MSPPAKPRFKKMLQPCHNKNTNRNPKLREIKIVLLIRKLVVLQKKNSVTPELLLPREE